MKTDAVVPSVDPSRLPVPFVARHPEWTDLCGFAWRLAATHIRRSRGRLHMDAAWDPARNYQWVWDTCFMALYCRYGAGQFPGVQSLDNFYELQRRDGYIGMTYDMTTGREPWPNRINPPLFAWVEWEYYRTTGDVSRLKRVLPPIERLMAWIDRNRLGEPRRCLAPDGRLSTKTYRLYHFEDCGSSGMDDSPRTPRRPDAGRFFDWIDLSSQMALSFAMLSRLHAAAGQTTRARHWSRRAAELGRTINRELWCERTRFYHDRQTPRNFVASKTAAGFWPILAGICPESRLDALVAHLEDPREFNRPTPVPTLSADDPNYSPEGVYWLGGVWAPTNYMIARGLMLAGRGDAAHTLARRYLDALARTFKKVRPHTLWECYAPEADQPGLAAYTHHRVKPHFVGWTGIGPIAMLIENVIGVDVNAPERTVTWDLRLAEAHGIRRLPLPDGSADLSCAARHSPREPAHVCAETTTPFTLVLRRANVVRRLAVRPGAIATARI
jgi:glycogen debranching enzyme